MTTTRSPIPTATTTASTTTASRTTPRTGAPPLVVELRAHAEPSIVGGKAAGLARAAAAGHAVPPGFVVTVGAAAAGRADIEPAVRAALAALGDARVAVRSSAVGEDGRQWSHAGQLASELDVPAAGVLDAIERCWASATALRALRYSGHVGGVAVIVQRMVTPAAAGVAFSADPRTGERGVAVIEAVHGLGDRLVAGEVDPERWRVTLAGPERTTATGGAAVLTAEQAAQIDSLVRRLEGELGGPQDVEWAFEGEVLHVLQSRPITALPATPVPIVDDAVPTGGWDRDDHHAVLSPLGWTWFQPYPAAMAASFRELGLPIEAIVPRRIGGHLYLQMVMTGGDAKPPPAWVMWLIARLAPSLRRAERTLRHYFDRDGHLELVDRWERELRARLQAENAALQVDAPEVLSDAELLARIEEVLAFTARGLELHAALQVPSLVGVGTLALFVEDHLGWTGAEVHELIAGTSASTTELHRQLETIVRAHRAELVSGLPRTWSGLAAGCPQLAAALGEWLATSRLRMLHYDPRHPTLGERPDYVLSIVEGIVHGLDAPPPAPGPDRLVEARSRLTPDRVGELDRLLAHARRTYALRDANGIETVSRPAGLLRFFVRELGRRLGDQLDDPTHAVYLYPDEHGPALRGELPALRARIEHRRGEESWAHQHRGPKRIGPPAAPPPPADAFPPNLRRMFRIINWMEASERGVTARGDELRGLGIGAQIVEGRARVLARPDELATLRHGEIVVCRITSPEWAVGLGRIVALITEEGGQLSHPAIIAREFGIPTVLGVEGATRRIQTGDRIRVDPVAGTVTPLAR